MCAVACVVVVVMVFGAGAEIAGLDGGDGEDGLGETGVVRKRARPKRVRGMGRNQKEENKECEGLILSRG